MQKQIRRREVAGAILRWYRQTGRKLPWRDIANPYRILLSEVMLQQTQVSRVLVKYPAFLRRFPTLHSLAKAKQRDVVLAWQGMGYNNRAVRLHRFAKEVAEHHNGRIPRDFETLVALPGIGKYTAHALLSSAFGMPLAIVDVNVQRVLSRLFYRMSSAGEMRPASEIWKLAGELLPPRNVFDWNQALMDLGATVCTARSPKCSACPIHKFCLSRSAMKRPQKSKVKREPSMNGTPNRLYRGRIIEVLRRRNGTGKIRAEVLGRAVYEGFSGKQESWLRKLLHDLERDGLVKVRGNGTLSTTHVSLA